MYMEKLYIIVSAYNEAATPLEKEQINFPNRFRWSDTSGRI